MNVVAGTHSTRAASLVTNCSDAQCPQGMRCDGGEGKVEGCPAPASPRVLYQQALNAIRSADIDEADRSARAVYDVLVCPSMLSEEGRSLEALNVDAAGDWLRSVFRLEAGGGEEKAGALIKSERQQTRERQLLEWALAVASVLEDEGRAFAEGQSKEVPHQTLQEPLLFAAIQTGNAKAVDALLKIAAMADDFLLFFSSAACVEEAASIQTPGKFAAERYNFDPKCCWACFAQESVQAGKKPSILTQMLSRRSHKSVLVLQSAVDHLRESASRNQAGVPSPYLLRIELFRTLMRWAVFADKRRLALAERKMKENSSTIAGLKINTGSDAGVSSHRSFHPNCIHHHSSFAALMLTIGSLSGTAPLFTMVNSCAVNAYMGPLTVDEVYGTLAIIKAMATAADGAERAVDTFRQSSQPSRCRDERTCFAEACSGEPANDGHISEVAGGDGFYSILNDSQTYRNATLLSLLAIVETGGSGPVGSASRSIFPPLPQSVVDVFQPLFDLSSSDVDLTVGSTEAVRKFSEAVARLELNRLPKDAVYPLLIQLLRALGARLDATKSPSDSMDCIGWDSPMPFAPQLLVMKRKPSDQSGDRKSDTVTKTAAHTDLMIPSIAARSPESRWGRRDFSNVLAELIFGPATPIFAAHSDRMTNLFLAADEYSPNLVVSNPHSSRLSSIVSQVDSAASVSIRAKCKDSCSVGSIAANCAGYPLEVYWCVGRYGLDGSGTRRAPPAMMQKPLTTHDTVPSSLSLDGRKRSDRYKGITPLLLAALKCESQCCSRQSYAALSSWKEKGFVQNSTSPPQKCTKAAVLLRHGADVNATFPFSIKLNRWDEKGGALASDPDASTAATSQSDRQKNQGDFGDPPPTSPSHPFRAIYIAENLHCSTCGYLLAMASIRPSQKASSPSSSAKYSITTCRDAAVPPRKLFIKMRSPPLMETVTVSHKSEAQRRVPPAVEVELPCLDHFRGMHLEIDNSASTIPNDFNHDDRSEGDSGVCAAAELSAFDDDYDLSSHVGETALHAAARNGCLMTTMALLEAGADLEAVDEEGYTALHMAAAVGNATIVHYLGAMEGASFDTAARTFVSCWGVAASAASPSSPTTSSVNTDGKGAADGREGTVPVGKKKKATTKRRSTPLRDAASRGHIKVVEVLIRMFLARRFGVEKLHAAAKTEGSEARLIFGNAQEEQAEGEHASEETKEMKQSDLPSAPTLTRYMVSYADLKGCPRPAVMGMLREAGLLEEDE